MTTGPVQPFHGKQAIDLFDGPARDDRRFHIRDGDEIAEQGEDLRPGHRLLGPAPQGHEGPVVVEEQEELAIRQPLLPDPVEGCDGGQAHGISRG